MQTSNSKNRSPQRPADANSGLKEKERIRTENEMAAELERKNDLADEGYVEIEFPLSRYQGSVRPARPRWPKRRL